jgi:hypothetical protein
MAKTPMLVSSLTAWNGVDPLQRFLGLTVYEVEQEAKIARTPVAIPRIWLSLSKLMRRRGYEVVRELGLPAATSWAVHLRVVAPDADSVARDRSFG